MILKMKRQYYLFPILAAVAVLFTGCFIDPDNTGTKVKVDPLLLPGRWEAPSQIAGADANAKLVYVFLKETCTVSNNTYGKWGYQLDQGDYEPADWELAEEQLLNQSAEGDYHKNGWFGWAIENDGEIQLYNTTSVGDAVVPYALRVKAFSSTEMTVIDAGRTYVFRKVQ